MDDGRKSIVEGREEKLERKEGWPGILEQGRKSESKREEE